MSKRVDDIRRLAQAIEMVVDAVAQDLHQGQLGVDEQIAIGHHLDSIGKRASKALDPLKASIRQEAVQQHAEPGNIILDSGHGPKCMVVIPKPVVKIRKDTDIEALQKLLGDRFDTFFATLTSYKPRQEFENRTAACADAKERQAVLDAVQVDEGTPRVSFKE